MKFYGLLVPALLFCAYSLKAENTENTENSTGWESACHELAGTYSYEVSGKIGPGLPPDNFSEFKEAGTIFFDCNGCGHASGVSTITYVPNTITTSRVLHPEYEFSYVWSCPNLVVVTAKRHDGLGTTDVRFVVGVGDKAEHISLIFLPNTTPVTTTSTSPVIAPPQAIWNYVEVSGTGGQ